MLINYIRSGNNRLWDYMQIKNFGSLRPTPVRVNSKKAWKQRGKTRRK